MTPFTDVHVSYICRDVHVILSKNSLLTNVSFPGEEKQADFHATLWEATVAKLHVALYIDIMMDEPTSHSFHFSTYLWLSFI